MADWFTADLRKQKTYAKLSDWLHEEHSQSPATSGSMRSTFTKKFDAYSTDIP